MTVKKLIEELRNYPDDFDVKIEHDDIGEITENRNEGYVNLWRE